MATAVPASFMQRNLKSKNASRVHTTLTKEHKRRVRYCDWRRALRQQCDSNLMCIPMRWLKWVFVTAIWTPWYPIVLFFQIGFWSLAAAVAWRDAPQMHQDFANKPLNVLKLFWILSAVCVCTTPIAILFTRALLGIICCNVKFVGKTCACIWNCILCRTEEDEDDSDIDDDDDEDDHIDDDDNIELDSNTPNRISVNNKQRPKPPAIPRAPPEPRRPLTGAIRSIVSSKISSLFTPTTTTTTTAR